MKAVTSEQMREMDRLTIEEIGVPGIVLMENASNAVSQRCIESLKDIKAPEAAVVCGGGNNGGDGFAVARILHCKGIKSSILFIGEEAKLKGDAKSNYNAAKNLGIDIITDIDLFENIIEKSDIVVDGIFGTGFSGAPKPPADQAISMINKSGKKVISIDVPSGVNADNGNVAAEAVRADETVTFALNKIGCILYPGAEYCGKITVADISIPKEIQDKVDVNCFILEESTAKQWLPKRRARSNKGSYGKLYVIAGSEEMTGAGVLCCKAAYRSGCGLVYGCIPKKCADVMHTLVPEVVVRPLSSYEGKVYRDSFEDISSELKKASAIAIGPGLGQSADVTEFIENILIESECKVLIDADGLNGIAGEKGILRKMKRVPVITPHPGEFSRLTGISVKDILKDTIGHAIRFAEKYNTVVVLKDARTVIASPDGEFYINTTGNNAMAKGGSGDVLSGIIGSFLAQGMEVFKAAVLGVYIHGACGDLAAEKYGHYGVLSGDLAEFLTYAIKNIEE